MQVLLNGSKLVETRHYALHRRYFGVDLGIIEKRANGDRLVVGLVRFSHSFVYGSKSEWVDDVGRHQVPADHPRFGWDPSKKKHGWAVERVERMVPPVPFQRPMTLTKEDRCIFAVKQWWV